MVGLGEGIGSSVVLRSARTKHEQRRFYLIHKFVYVCLQKVSKSKYDGSHGAFIHLLLRKFFLVLFLICCCVWLS